MRRSRDKINEELPKLKIELGYKQVLFIAFSVIIFFFAPVYVISQNSNPNSNEGRVAGLSTSSEDVSPITKLQIFLQDKNNQLLFVGSILTTISGTTLVLLAAENFLRKK